jgi:hypothetical protein
MDFFLKLKHWQLFVLMFFVPNIIMSVAGSSLLTVRILCAVVVIGFYFGWLYSLGTALHKKLPNRAEVNQLYFKISFLILSLLSFGLVIWELSAGSLMHDHMIILLLLLVFGYIWAFYIFYFVARSLKTVELQRPVTYYEYIDIFFLLWFYPIGVWFIQPKVNAIFEKSTS